MLGSVGTSYYAQPRLNFDAHLGLLASAGVRIGGRALDVGCGEGHLGRLLLDAGFAEVVGVEPYETAASLARTKLTQVVSASFPTPEVADLAPFDLVVFADSLEHIVNPWEALRVASQFLVRGGHILVSVPNVGHYSVILQQIQGRWTYANEGLLDRSHLRFFTPATLQEALSAEGLLISASTHTKAKPRKRWAWPAVSLLECFRPQLFWYQVLVVARRV